MLRIGIIGFGMAARVFHAPLISSVDGLELAAVVERHGDQAAQRYPGLKIYRSLEELLADSSIDLAVVATPSGTHFDVARQVLASRKHAVVDKPVSVTSVEVAQLIELARANGTLLIPFHNRRWDGDFLTVQKLLHEHQLGRVVNIESRFDRWNPGATRRPWKDDPSQGGGVLLDLGTHLVDQALVLCGKPLAISADVLRERDGDGSDDAFTIRMRYEKCFVTLGANALSSPAGARFHVRGTRGNFRKKGVDPQEAALNKITRISAADWGQEPPTEWGLLCVDVEGGMVSRPVTTVAGDYRLFYAGVRDALSGQCSPQCLPPMHGALPASSNRRGPVRNNAAKCRATGAENPQRLLSRFSTAAISPGMSCASASAAGSQPAARSVSLVTGPMDTAGTPANGKPTFACRATSARCVTLEELVNVAASSPSANARRSCPGAASGMTFRYASTTSTIAPAFRSASGITSRATWARASRTRLPRTSCSSREVTRLSATRIPE